MSDPAWPDALPAPSIAGYGMEPEERVLRTPMQSGPARQRRQYTASPTMFPVRWVFTPTQMAVFEAWHHYEIDDGAAWFSIELQTGAGINSETARFTAMWKARALNKVRWEVSGTLEIRSRTLISEETLAGYL